MKAMIFAAGLGTRLRPLTDSMPKALVDVGGMPMLERVIRKLKKNGVTEIVVNVHHFPDMITDFLDQNRNFGLTIHVSDERNRLLDTGGGIAKAIGILGDDEPVLVHNVDILTDFDVNAMLCRHVKSGADATLLTSARTTSRYLLFDGEQRMQGWCNVSTGEVQPHDIDANSFGRLAFGGVHILSPRMLKRLREYSCKEDVFSIVPFYIDVCREMDIRAFVPDMEYHWVDIGKPESLSLAGKYVSEGILE